MRETFQPRSFPAWKRRDIFIATEAAPQITLPTRRDWVGQSAAMRQKWAKKLKRRCYKASVSASSPPSCTPAEPYPDLSCLRKAGKKTSRRRSRARTTIRRSWRRASQPPSPAEGCPVAEPQYSIAWEGTVLLYIQKYSRVMGSKHSISCKH